MTRWGKFFIAVAVVILLILAAYVVLHSWAPVVPEVIPPGLKDLHMDARAGVASAVQETVGLITTLLLAVTAFFAFSVSDRLDTANDTMAKAILLCAVYSAALTIGALTAYETYRAIALQLDMGYLFLQPLSNLLAKQTWSLIICLVLSLAAFGWRCATR